MKQRASRTGGCPDPHSRVWPSIWARSQGVLWRHGRTGSTRARVWHQSQSLKDIGGEVDWIIELVSVSFCLSVSVSLFGSVICFCSVLFCSVLSVCLIVSVCPSSSPHFTHCLSVSVSFCHLSLSVLSVYLRLLLSSVSVCLPPYMSGHLF
jgi:hypothetical protein